MITATSPRTVPAAPTARRFVAAGLLLGSVAAVAVGCSAKPTEVSTEITSQTIPAVTVPQITITMPNIPVVPTTEKVQPGTTAKPGTTVPRPPATVKRELSGPEFAAEAVAQYRKKLGDFKALDLKIWVGDNQRAEAQIQDPDKPENVDAFEFRGQSVGSPVPVRLTGAGDLEANLFPVADVNTSALAAMFDQAVIEIGNPEGSTGVTHVVITKNLPVDEDTVVNVYVDGGTRGGGGYVSFLTDGSLKAVHASK